VYNVLSKLILESGYQPKLVIKV